jgi:siderophore synthetase component
VHPDLVEGDADDLLDERGWPLLPCHPWQAGFLAERMPAGKVVPLGPSGEEALPTSSVRTVYLPRADRFFKLPLDVRITNFVRTNPREHVRRTLAASRLLREVEIPFGITILHETGYRAIAPLFDSSAVIFREGLRGSEPRVLAALLEPIDPPLAELVFEAAQARAVPVTPAFVCSWLSRYLELALLPVLRLFARHGISLEAHAQNTLLATEAGWPARVYIRDLEGTSVSRRRAANGADATLLVDESEALKRLRYYLVTNQIAHVVATLAAHTPADEWQLWQIVRSVVEDDPDARPLLDTPDLPAKANLVSRMAGRSETPTYVSIPNPLRTVVEP